MIRYLSRKWREATPEDMDKLFYRINYLGVLVFMGLVLGAMSQL